MSTASKPRCRGSPSVDTRRTRSPSRSRTTASSPAAACGKGTCTSVRPGYTESATAASASEPGLPADRAGVPRGKGHGPRRRSAPVAPCAFPSKSRGASSLPVPPERGRAPFPFLPSEVEGLFRASARIHQPTRTTRKLSSSVVRSPHVSPDLPFVALGLMGSVGQECVLNSPAGARRGCGHDSDVALGRSLLLPI